MLNTSNSVNNSFPNGVYVNGNLLLLGGPLTTLGAYSSTFTMTAITNVTFPTSGTLATTAQVALSIYQDSTSYTYFGGF